MIKSMDRSSKYYISANMWLIAMMAVSLSGYTYTAIACAITAAGNVIAERVVRRSETP
jgi:hypothetical protein